MTAKLTLDKAGRVVIPKRLRDQLHMAAGDSFQLESTDDQIVLKPLRDEPRMIKEHGYWVFQSGEPISQEQTDSVLQKIREERDAQNRGEA